MRSRSLVILLVVVVALAALALVARSHGIHVMPIVRVMHGQH